MSFRISALQKSLFEHLFTMNPNQLAQQGALRETVQSKPGSPCRVSLADAEIGEQVLLVHYEHQSADTPFRASHAIYVRPAADQVFPAVDEVPELFRTRILSLRGFEEGGMMIKADLAEGRELECGIEQIFAIPRVAYIHLHYARPGCYAARVDRA